MLQCSFSWDQCAVCAQSALTTIQQDGYELVDGYYYHGEPPKTKEYKEYESEYPEYSNYPDKFLPKVCIQSLPTQAQQNDLLAFLNNTQIGDTATIE